jgi:nitrate/nitrite-specific signal transduction histidine kinase
MSSIFRPIVVLLAFLLAAPPALAQITDVNAAINKAGRERMLSQRIAKSAQVSLLGNQAALTELSTSRT